MKLRLNSSADTAEFARKIASLLQNQDMILLYGDLGAGKTFFAREVIKSLNPKVKEVASPTFNLVQIYDCPQTDIPQIWHFDLYRLESPEEIWETGFEEAMAEGVSLIEWPEKMGRFIPREALEIRFETVAGNKDAREAEIVPLGKSWQERLAQIHF